jgi:F420-dependent oxidoreductase-like protein
MELNLMIEGQEGVSWSEWQAIAAACETHLIPMMWRSDHYMNLDGAHPERGSLDAWATLNALAAVTSTLRLGTMVSPASFRHPSELAKVVTTADHVSGGRIELGLGAGWHEREHAAFGFPFADLRTRMEVLAEQLEVVHGTWAPNPPGPFTFNGRHYRLTDLDAQPKPVQRPHPPLIMGGNAGPRSCRLAARFADEYNTVYPTLDDVRERRARVVAACRRAGREPIPFSVMTSVIAGRDEAEVQARVARVAGRTGADPVALRNDPPAGWVVGVLDSVVEQLRALREAGVARVMCQHLAHDDLEFIALLGDVIAPECATG